MGLSRINSVSNHSTYLPPGLRYLDPGFLAGDWWLDASQHYHFAYFALTAALAGIGMLEVGLALLNVAVVAVTLHAAFRIMVWLRTPHPLACLAVLIAIFLSTYSFYSVGATYMFMQSLQPSSVAVAATLVALQNFLEERPFRTGIWLGIGGLFHLNYLVGNIPLFALAYGLRAVLGFDRRLLDRRHIFELLKILGPSLMLTAAFLPVLLLVEGDRLSPALAAEADWIFFRFAAPYHYYPRTWLAALPTIAGWQVLGMLWTSRAAPDPGQRRAVWAVQIAFVLVLWSAIALVTLVFVPQVARLLLWRLAPLASFFAALITIVGAVRLIARPSQDRDQDRRAKVWDSAILLAGFAIPIWLLPAPHGPLWLLPLFVVVAVRLWTTIVVPASRYLIPAALLAAMAFFAWTLPGNDDAARYSLVLPPTPYVRDEDALFAFARQSIPADAQVLIPPALDMFRLRAERAVVVDYKAIPVDRAGLVDWYRRLSDVSGEPHPTDIAQVVQGYQSLDAARLEHLRRKYRLSHVVVYADRPLSAPGWREVYRNSRFRVFAHGVN